MSSNIEQLIMSMAKDMANKPHANNFKFRNEEDALYHASRVTQLKIGSYIMFRDSVGIHNAVVLGVETNGRVSIAIYNPEDGEIGGINIPPSCIIFDDMPEERTEAPLSAEAYAYENCGGDEWDGAGLPDEFPRT